MPLSKDTLISKSLSWLLRHGAEKDNIPMTEEGFVNVADILKHRQFYGKSITLGDLKRIVSEDNKQRYALRENPETGCVEIKANQGHTIILQKPNLAEILDPGKYPEVIHGTYYKNWDQIKLQGLNRMKRMHIHFAKGTDCISGVRRNCQIYIYVNLALALNEGYKFYESENQVILSPGNELGYLPTNYFLKVVDVKTSKKLSKSHINNYHISKLVSRQKDYINFMDHPIQ